MFSRLLTLLVMLSLGGVAQALVDPTRPATYIDRNTGVEVNSGPSELKLQSVLLGTERKLAVINGRSYGVGDVIGDAEVVSINEQGVVVRRAGQNIKLPLRELGVIKIRRDEY